jgi:hypothetical protein
VTPENSGPFVVGVFQDASWARRGVDALLADGFASESLSILALESPAAAELIGSVAGAPPDTVELKALGPVVARGSLVTVLQGADAGLKRSGLGATIHRAGFLAHDGLIFEALVGRGGVLVAVRTEPRAADALARFHAFGGGNAAIGAWTGRV